jgi:hypothetical protein
MRTIVDIPKEDLMMLDAIAKREGVSRAEIFRRMAAKERANERERRLAAMMEMESLFKNTPDAFDGLDGLAWQQKTRAEWDEREEGLEHMMAEINHPSAQDKKPYLELAEPPQRPYQKDEK